MLMNFGKGAIIRFGFNCQVTGVVDTGRVIKVTKKEIVLIPQVYVMISCDKESYPDFPSEIVDRNRSVDSNREVHIDRKLIASWEYASIDTQKTYSNTYKSEYIDKDKYKVNYYEENGHCKGAVEVFEA